MSTVRHLLEDVDASVGSYTEHLGFTLDEQLGSAFARISLDGLTVWLSGPQSCAARPMPDGARPEPGGWNRFVVEVADLPAEVEAMRQAGVPFRNEIVVGPGGKQILVQDPSGNVIELFQPAG
jgi:catechol 2,3-dioxygenase-like lactoylglutathione lyase family enzyme